MNARRAVVRHAHLWGERAAKYEWLAAHDAETTEWQEVAPTSPMYFFIPRDARLAEEYETGWSLLDAMVTNGPGVTTARDHAVIGIDRTTVLRQARYFRDSNSSDEEVCRELDIPLKLGWDVASARRLIRSESNLDAQIKPIEYRPFDVRLIFYHDSLVWRTVKQTMRHLTGGSNLGLITTRQTRDNWDAFATRNIIDHKALAAYDINTLFPLYLYPEPTAADPTKPTQHSFGADDAPSSAPGGRRANLAPEFIRDFSERLGLAWVPDGRGDRTTSFGPEDVFSYLYAIFHSPSYRERYADFLKSDFPRVPLTRDTALFRTLCALGDRLVALHLLEASAAGQPGFPIAGDNRVEAPRYREPDAAQARAGCVYLNKEQYFEGVSPEVWAFHIGGYQVAEKWLKDRKGRTLSYADIEHYQRTIAALAETISLMAQVDEAIEEHGGWPLG